MRFCRQIAWILTAGSVQLLAFPAGSSYAAGSTFAQHTPSSVLPHTSTASAKSQSSLYPMAPPTPNIHTPTSAINHPSLLVHTSDLRHSSFNPAYLPNLLSHLNLDLGSTVHSLSAQLLNPLLKNSVLLTPAEFLSTALGHNGSSLHLGSNSEAISGTIVLPPGLTSLSSLIIPAGITVVDRAPALTISGTLSNSGTILVVGGSSSHSVISAVDIVNSGNISADPSVSLSLNAVNSLNNSGTIHASNLTIQSPSISNSGILSTTAGNLSLNTNLLNNSGVIQSSQNINISALDSSSLLINQTTAGLISAGSTILGSSASDLSIKGGMLSAQNISLNAPNGKLSVNLQDIQGLVDVNAQCASFNVSSGKHGLNIHSFHVTGDPDLVYVGSGPFVSSGFNSDGGDVIIDTTQDEENGSITFTGTIDTTPTSSGNGGKVILLAGTTLNVTNVDTNANGQGNGGLIELQAYGNISDGSLVANGQSGNGAIVVSANLPIPQASSASAGTTLTLSGQSPSPSQPSSPPSPLANIRVADADSALPQLSSQTNFYQASIGAAALQRNIRSYDAPLTNGALEEQAAPLSQLFVFDGVEGPQVVGFENIINDLHNVFLLSKPLEKTNGRITASIKQTAEHTIAINGVDFGKASLELTENSPPTIDWQQGRLGLVSDSRCFIRTNMASVEIPGKSMVIIDSPDKNSLRISNLGSEDAATVTVAGQIITVASKHELLIENAKTNSTGPADSDGLRRSFTNRTSRNGVVISQLSLNEQLPASALIAGCPSRCTSLRVKRSLSDAKASVQKTLVEAVSASKYHDHSSFSPIAAVSAPTANIMRTHKMRTNNCELYYLSDPSFIMDGDNLHLHEGELLVSAAKPTSIKTANTQINLPAHTLALLKSNQEVLHVYTIWGHGAGAVKVINAGQEHRVATGEELLLGRDSSTVSGLIEADSLGRRRLNLFESSREAGCLAEVSMVSLIQNSPLLQALVKGINPASSCMAEKIKKISACISITSAAHGPFSR